MLDLLKKYLIEGVTRPVLEAYEVSLNRHIEEVQYAGAKLGVASNQLDIHDDSKYSLEEFPYYARQFHGDKGDPDGFAYAWLHHIHANPHHWQHFIFPDEFMLAGSNIEPGGVVEMPEKYALEMVADWQSASFCYTNSWDMTSWLQKNSPKIILHSHTASYVEKVLSDLGYRDIFFSTNKKSVV